MRSPTPRSVVHEAARQKLLPFLILAFEILHPGQHLEPSWYLRAMCYWLERVEAGFLLRSMIWLQPRALKSITVAVVFPCWLLGRDPRRQIMVVTYSDALGRTHAQHRLRILESDMYARIFPTVRIASDGRRQMDTLFTSMGRIRAISVEGTATGLGAHFIILDDCMKAEDCQSQLLRDKNKNWYESTISTRVIDERSSIISIQQRLHEDDLPAFLEQKGYECLCLPAVASKDMTIACGPDDDVYHWRRNEVLCPELLSEAGLAAKRIEHGPQAFAAQFLQTPIAPEGAVVPMHQIKRFETPIHRDMFEKVFQSWDTAASTLPTADWSVGMTWGYLGGRLFLLDIYRKRVEYGELKRAVIALRAKWRADAVIIERVGVGMSLCQELRRNGPFRPIEAKPSENKEERLLAQTGQIEEGRVWLPAELPGLDAFLSELRAFPFGKHDDQVDTLTQLLEYIMYNWRTANTPYTPDGRPIRIIRSRERPPPPPLPEWVR